MSLTADRVRIKPASGEDAPNAQLRKAPLRRGGWGEKLSHRNTALARALLAVAVALIELSVVFCAALITETFYHGFAHGWSGVIPPNTRLCSLVALLFVLSNASRGEYRIPDFLASRVNGWRLFTVWSTSFLIALAFSFLTKSTGEFSRAGVVLFYVAGYAAIYVTRLASRHIARDATAAGGVASRRVVLVGFEESVKTFTQRYQPSASGMNVVAAIGLRDEAECIDDDLALAAATARMLRPDDVFILVPWSQTEVIDSCVTTFLRVPAQIHLGPERVLDRFVDARIDKIGTISSLSLGGHPLDLVEVIVKRLFDIVVSVAALVLLSPLLALVAALIRLDSNGPALFTQRRYGFNQEAFRIFKFRSMTTMEDGRDIAQAKVQDPRITRIGRFIRRYNVDELPQLINVLRGEMSLVGPRPHALVHDQLFERKIALYARRHNVKPGITGWAQVNGLRGEIDGQEKIRQRVEHDLYYIDNWSLLFDVWIIFLTVFSKKAYRNAV
ncbi:MAG: undecaprenyl-phosphate glucose phosphotransferase [Methylocystis sp.]